MAITYDTPISKLGLTTQAPKALAEAGITTIGQLLERKHEDIAGLRGMGATRLAELDSALEKLRLSFDKPLPDLSKYARCAHCPTCSDCGNPRATSARNVVNGLDGRAAHIGHRDRPVCDGCDKHHRSLFAAAAA